MRRARAIAFSSGAAGVVLVASLVAASLGASPTATRQGQPPGGGGSSGPSASPEPSPSAIVDEQSPPATATIDPYYGDVVAVAPVGSTATLGASLTLDLVAVSSITVTGSGIGSMSGPGVTVEVRITNTGSSRVDVAAVVNAYVGDDRVPLSPAGEDEAVASSLSAGAQSVGRYTFATGGADGTLWITVSTGPDSGLAVFQHG